MNYEDSTISCRLSISRQVRYPGEGCLWLDYHREGRFVVMATKDSSLHLIDSLNGVEKKKMYTRSHGIGEVQYTHHESCVLLSSDVARDRRFCDIRYLCMYDNRYLRYYKGHTDKVTSLSMSPIEDYFLSTSNDKSVRLWNINSPTSLAQMNLPDYVTNPVVRYEGEGLCLAYSTRTTARKAKV